MMSYAASLACDLGDRLDQSASRDIRRLDQQVARRVYQAVEHYATTDQGNVIRLQGTGDELRLRVGDWRVRFTERIVTRPAEPPATGEVQVRLVEVSLRCYACCRVVAPIVLRAPRRPACARGKR
jgi:hypothetical protein